MKVETYLIGWCKYWLKASLENSETKQNQKKKTQTTNHPFAFFLFLSVLCVLHFPRLTPFLWTLLKQLKHKDFKTAFFVPRLHSSRGGFCCFLMKKYLLTSRKSNSVACLQNHSSLSNTAWPEEIISWTSITQNSKDKAGHWGFHHVKVKRRTNHNLISGQLWLWTSSTQPFLSY